MIEIQFAAAKINKYATRESGDTVEVVERPHGGYTLVLVDGQGSGRAAKMISQMVASKVLALIKDGARDGAAARAAHDYLYLQRGGKVSATLTLLTVDLASRTLLVTRNGHCPVALYGPAGGHWLAAESPAIGLYRHTRPRVHEQPLAAGTWVVAFSDGVLEAGRRTGQEWDLRGALGALFFPGVTATPRQVAGTLLDAALAEDQNRPQDDMSVVVLAIAAAEDGPQIRTLDLRAPTD